MVEQATAAEPDVEEITRAFAGVELRDWIVTAAIILSSFVVSKIIRRTTKRIAAERRSSAIEIAGRFAGHGVLALGTVYGLSTLGVRITPLLGAAGVVTFALAFALQDILENFAASLLLQFRRPFRKGDEVESEEFAGVVTGIDSRTVTVISPEGETVRLPSADVLKSAIVNQSTIGKRRTTLNVSVAYGTDLDHATKVLAEAALVDGVLATPAPEALVFNFNDSGIDIAVRFWHGPSIAARWAIRDAVARSIHRAVGVYGIEIPFPQRVIRTVDSVPADH